MNVFGAYSRYYDLLYRDKDYAAEARYVDALIRERLADARSLLEIGCGTGRYSREFVRLGYEVHGVDLSEAMLDEAKKKNSDDLSFSRGDMRTLCLGRRFDAVVALFHVLSYQTTDDDVAKALASVQEHLNPTGVTVLDFWYAPAVLSQKPEVRFKEVSDEAIEVARVALPVLHSDTNTVDVNYRAFIKDKASGQIEELRECHRMRYFFDGEVRGFLERAGLGLRSICAWMKEGRPDLSSWAACLIARRR